MSKNNKGSFAYLTVYNSVKNDIQNGKYLSGELLPTEKELEQKYYVSRTTVRKAVAMLVEDKVLKVKQGYGTEVLTNKTVQNLNTLTSISKSLADKGHKMGVKKMHIEIITASKEMCEILNLPPNSKLASINRIQTSDGVPITIAKNYIPYNLVAGIENYSKKITSLYLFLREKYGITITGSKDTISACNASFEDAVLLETEPQNALITVKRICYMNENPIEIDEVKIIASKYEFEVFKNN